MIGKTLTIEQGTIFVFYSFVENSQYSLHFQCSPKDYFIPGFQFEKSCEDYENMIQQYERLTSETIEETLGQIF